MCEDSESSQAKKMKSYCALLAHFHSCGDKYASTSSGYFPTGTCWSVIVKKYNAKSDFGVN